MAIKTNAMRMLEKEKISYTVFTYEVDENDLSGIRTARILHQNPDKLFKTLVVKNEKKQIYVFCIPVAETLDLKKAAKCIKSKSIEMVAVKDLLSVCGYQRGSCSPIGMKKTFPTYIDETCILFDSIFISAGEKGKMLEINTVDFLRFVQAEIIDLCRN